MKKTFLISIALASAFTTTAVMAAPKMEHEGLPPMDPVLAYAQQLAPRDSFFLNSDRDIELVRFSSMRDHTICVPRSARGVDAPRQNIGVKVSWDGNEATVEPGHCFSFDAKKVSVTPAGPLPDDVDLVGTIRTSK